MPPGFDFRAVFEPPSSDDFLAGVPKSGASAADAFGGTPARPNGKSIAADIFGIPDSPPSPPPLSQPPPARQQTAAPSPPPAADKPPPAAAPPPSPRQVFEGRFLLGAVQRKQQQAREEEQKRERVVAPEGTVPNAVPAIPWAAATRALQSKTSIGPAEMDEFRTQQRERARQRYESLPTEPGQAFLYEADGGGYGLGRKSGAPATPMDTAPFDAIFVSRGDAESAFINPSLDMLSRLGPGQYTILDLHSGEAIGDARADGDGAVWVYDDEGSDGVIDFLTQQYLAGTLDLQSSFQSFLGGVLSSGGGEDAQQTARELFAEAAEATRTANTMARDFSAAGVPKPIIDEDGSVSVSPNTAMALIARTLPSYLVSGGMYRLGALKGAKTAKTGAIGSNAVLVGGSSASEARETALRGGASEEDADAAARRANFFGSLLGIATGQLAYGKSPTAGAAAAGERGIGRRVLDWSVKSGAFPGILREAGQEAIEEIGQLMVVGETTGLEFTGRDYAESALAGALGGAGTSALTTGGGGALGAGAQAAVNYGKKNVGLWHPEGGCGSRQSRQRCRRWRPGQRARVKDSASIPPEVSGGFGNWLGQGRRGDALARPTLDAGRTAAEFFGGGGGGAQADAAKRRAGRL